MLHVLPPGCIAPDIWPLQNIGCRNEKKGGLDSQIIRAKYRVPIFTLAGWKIANFNGFNFNPEQSFILAPLSSSNEV